MKGRALAAGAVLAAAIALPWILRAGGAEFYVSLATRVLVFAIAATSLNLLLWYAAWCPWAMRRSSGWAAT